MKTLRKYFLALLLLELLFTYAPAAYAQTADYTQGNPSCGNTPFSCPVSGQIEKYLCAPTTASTGNLYDCINRLYKFAIILATTLGVFFLVIAGFIYMSAEGNQESVDKAKNILVTTVTSLVILFAGFLLLKTINPDLVEFQSIQPQSVVLPLTPAPTSPLGSVGTTAPSAAQQLLNLNGSKINISGSGSCPGNNPLVDIKAIASGQPAQFDGPGSACNQGTTGIDPTMLQTLTNIANSGLPITITSLTSGHHSSASDPHYAGEAVDLVPQNLQSNGQNILQMLINGGAAKVAVECNLGGAAQFIVMYPAAGSNVDATKCTGQPNYHWHAQWSGTSGSLGNEIN